MNENNSSSKQLTINDIENQIRNNQFSSKDQLADHLLNLRNNGLIQIDNGKIRELLNLFDSLSKKEENVLDTQKYASVGLESQDLIVSKESNRVLKTLEGTTAFADEFRQTQNDIIANTQNGMTNADTIFEHMATHQKEEMSLIPVAEAITQQHIDIEILNKIKFFITESNLNLYAFRVDTRSGAFYNLETNEVYEIRKNENTGQYEIYRSGEKIYSNNQEETIEKENEQELANEPKSEEMEPQSRTNKPKTRALRPPYMGNAAFTKIGFLVINIITFGLLVTMAILLRK